MANKTTRGATGIKFAGGTQHLGWAPPMAGSPGEPYRTTGIDPGAGPKFSKKVTSSTGPKRKH